MNTYTRQTTVRLKSTTRDTAGALTTPNTITLRIKAPDGTITTPSPSLLSLGIYYYDLLLNQEGVWEYAFEATTPTVAAQNRLFVKNSPFYSS